MPGAPKAWPFIENSCQQALLSLRHSSSFHSRVSHLRREVRNPIGCGTCSQEHAGEDQPDDNDREPFVRTRCAVRRFLGAITSNDRSRPLGFWRRGDRKRNVRKFRGADEAVTLSRNRFNIKRLIRGFAKSLPQLVHRGVDVCIVIDMRVGRPQSLFQLIASDHFALLLQEYNQNLVDLALWAQARASTKNLLALLIY